MYSMNQTNSNQIPSNEGYNFIGTVNQIADILIVCDEPDFMITGDEQE